MPTKTWSNGDVLSASDLNTYVRDQWITICTAGTRPTTSTDGRVIYETDTNRYYRWSTGSSSWVLILGGSETWIDYTPTVTQSGALTITNTSSRYRLSGKTCTVAVLLTMTSAGTGGSPVLCSLPVTAAVTSDRVIGAGEVIDTSNAQYAGAACLVASGTYVAIRNGGTTTATYYVGSDPNFAVANGDKLSFTVTYEI